MKPVIVQCDALSYSGTTWLNLCLGTHEKALTIGPPHKLWELKDGDISGLCQVHGKDCEFWTGFNTAWDRAENIFTALMAYSGKTHFIFDNPPADFIAAYMQPADVDVKHLRYVRDARAITASYARKVPATSFYDSIQPDGWFYHSFMAIPAEQDVQNVAYMRYEDCAKNLAGFLEKAGAHIGLDYAQQNTRFWEADHHITSGNTGPINMVRLHQGLEMPNFESKAVYQAQYEKLVKDPDDTFFDERWRSQLSREDLFYFDLLLGDHNQKLGYERDQFTDEEIREFWIAYGPSVNQGARAALPHGVMCAGQRRFNATNDAKSVIDKKSANATIIPTNVYAEQINDYDEKGENTPDDDSAKPLNNGYETTYLSEKDQFGIRQILPPIDDQFIKKIESTTQYYDGVDPDKLKSLGEYRTESGPYDKTALEQLVVNANMYAGYGPDYLAKHSLALTVDPISRYRDLLIGLKTHSKIEFKTFKDGLKTKPQPDEVCGLIRHDVDGDLMAALDMAKIENKLGIKSTYFLLHTAPYYGIMQNGIFQRNEDALDIYREIQSLGHEIGVHTDTLELYQNHKVDGAKGLITELKWLRDNGLEICGSLAHNSYAVYGANNYTIFEDRPLNTFYYAGNAKAVTHNGRWSPLQQLSEEEIGLTYEGNEVFWQSDTYVDYYALMHQAMWFRVENLYGTLQNASNRPKGISSWLSQEEVVDNARYFKSGSYAVIVVHPLHYGTRAHKLDNPNHVVARALEPNKDWLEALINSNKGDANVKTTPVDNGDDSDAIIVSGHLGSHLEFATAHVPDENGGFDRPMERLSEGDVKFMFLGRDNFAAQSLPADSKISQMTVSLLKHAHNLHHIQMRAASYTAPDINGPAVKSFLNTLPADQAPQIIIVGLSQADLDETGEESLIDFLNENAGVKFTVFGVVERSGLTDIAVDTPLVEALRARAVFQIFDPSTVFEHYSQNATGAIYWKSSPEWAYQGHYIAAKMLSDGLVDFVKLLKSQMDEAA